ncbi:hypothetical protein XENTR_v10010695 [Xenopus tropicalis]|nr:hypothetical protein XENTR_v10010695 [Xenopus tropicalis]
MYLGPRGLMNGTAQSGPSVRQPLPAKDPTQPIKHSLLYYTLVFKLALEREKWNLCLIPQTLYCPVCDQSGQRHSFCIIGAAPSGISCTIMYPGVQSKACWESQA